MRALILTQQAFGSYRTFSETLRKDLPKHGVEAETCDASLWMPNQTGQVDRAVTKKLRDIAADYDIVHAMGFRAAWACAEAFGDREAWIFSAHDLPRSSLPELVSRLSCAFTCLCASDEVRSSLKDIGLSSLRVLPPSPDMRPRSTASKQSARQLLNFGDDPWLLACGRFIPERSLHTTVECLGAVRQSIPNARLYIAGEGPDLERIRFATEKAGGESVIRLVGPSTRILDLVAAADAVIVPSLRAGTSLLALEAMSLRTPLVIRDLFAFREIAEPGVSAWFFDSDEELASKAVDALTPGPTQASLVEAANLRAGEFFELESTVRAIAQIYRSVINP